MPVNVFGSGAIQTAYVSWAEYVLDAGSTPLELVWPNSYLSNPDVVPLFLSIDNSANNSTGVVLPNAEFVSVGQNVIVYNNSTHNFFLYSNSGANLGTITANNAFYFVLRDNTTIGGSWQSFAFATGTINPNVSAMAGYGLTALAADSFTTLNEHIVTNLKDSNYNLVLGDWGKSIIGTSTFAQTFTLPPASTTNLVGGYFGYISNVPSAGNITVQPGAGTNLNDNSGPQTVALSPTDSLMFVYDTSPTTPTYWIFPGTGLPQVLPVSRGGTGSSTVPGGFNNIAPSPTLGAIMAVVNGSDWGSPLANSLLSGNSLISNATTSPYAPSWTGLGILQIQTTIVNTEGPSVPHTVPTVLVGADDVALEVTITPRFANSKIFVMATANINADSTGTGGQLLMARNGTAINIGTGGLLYNATSLFIPTTQILPYTFFYLDTPATTSAVTYSILGATFDMSKEYSLNSNFATNAVTSSSIMAIEIGGW